MQITNGLISDSYVLSQEIPTVTVYLALNLHLCTCSYFNGSFLSSYFLSFIIQQCPFYTGITILRYLLSIYQVIYLQKTFLVQPFTPIPNYHFIHSPHSIAASSILIHHKTPYTYLNIETIIPCTMLQIFL